MAQQQDNATAPFVVFAYDGTNVGVVSSWTSQAEADADAQARKQLAPDHVEYYSSDQQGMREKVAELTGVEVSSLADAENTRPKGVEGSTASDAHVDEVVSKPDKGK